MEMLEKRFQVDSVLDIPTSEILAQERIGSSRHDAP